MSDRGHFVLVWLLLESIAAMRDARAATACQRSSARTAARSVGRRWWCCVTTAGWSAPVQVFGRRDDETIHALRRCFDGHVWTPIVSSGDVAVMVSRLRQRALVTGPMDEDRGLTCAINWDDWHESLRSDLLRRAEAARHHPDAGWLCRRAPAAMRLPWPTWLHQPSPRRVQSSMALARVGVSDSVRSRGDGERGRAAAIRHVNHANAGHHLEQLAGHMDRRSISGRRHVELARIALGVRDKFWNRLGGNRQVHFHDVG